MGIYNIVTGIKKMSMNIPICNMASFGDISLYDNKATILYPYVNIDIVNNQVFNNGVKRYIFRIYVVDRNEPYVAYNKTELILDNLMMKMGVQNYTTNYFTLDYQDLVNGVYTDVLIDSEIGLTCMNYNDSYLVQQEDNTSFILINDGGKIIINE